MRHGLPRFRLRGAALLIVPCAMSAAVAQDDASKAGRQVLDRFVGVWQVDVTDKPSKWIPDGRALRDREVGTRILKDRFVLGRVVRGDEGTKALWLMTYDAKSETYPFWWFDNRGVLGGEWSSTWDEASRTLTGRATDTPPGWTSSGINRFAADGSTDHVTIRMRDETGALLLDSESTKSRRPDAEGEAVVAVWSKTAPPAEPFPPERKVLERLVGEWDAASVAKPAVWTPQETRTTSKVTRTWVLDGRFLQDASFVSDGQEGLSLFAFDAPARKFRGWWFNSEGHRNKSVGDWDEAAGTLNMSADLDGGLVARSTVRFVDGNRHVWTVLVRDGDGRTYFDAEWTVTRRPR